MSETIGEEEVVSYCQSETGILLVGNCLDRLRDDLDDCSVDSIVTDPPYELGFMGASWDSTGIANNVELWKECLRVLKPGGYLVAAGGTRTYHRMVCAIEDAGFEIRDSIHWTYGSGFPKSHNQVDDKKQKTGFGSAMKPSHEPIVVARKGLCGTLDENWKQWGTGYLNIGACRVGSEPIVINGQGNDNLFHGNFSGNVGDDPNRVGRWPANTILCHNHDCQQTGTRTDDMPEMVRGVADPRWVTAVAGGVTPAKTVTVAQWACTAGCPCADLDQQSGANASRFFTQANWDVDWDGPTLLYYAKPSKRERNAGLDGLPVKAKVFNGKSDTAANKAEGSVEDKFSTLPQTNSHPTVKPVALMRHLIRLVTPPGGTVLDPFLGSGTTAVAAILEGFQWVGCEMTDDYLPIISGRVAHAEKTLQAPQQLQLGDSNA